MAGSSSQYLQVPKVPLRRPKSPGHKSSKSRLREDRPEAVTPFTPARPESPPMPAAEPYRKPSLSGFANARLTEKYLASSHTNGHDPTIPIRMSEPVGTNYQDLSLDLNGLVYSIKQCAKPPPTIPLREKLVGAWKLESYVAYPTATSMPQRPTYPMTKNVTGFIMYTPDGYMSAQMLIPGQPSFKRSEGDEAQWTEAAKRFFAYSGPYYISNEGSGREEVLRHTFQICNLPGWIGDIQIRTHRFEEDGDVLVLGSEEPAEIKVCGHLLVGRLCFDPSCMCPFESSAPD